MNLLRPQRKVSTCLFEFPAFGNCHHFERGKKNRERGHRWYLESPDLTPYREKPLHFPRLKLKNKSLWLRI